ncbi:MAG: deaminase [Ignavibacteria bacterium CG2_30_36_16]|nr:dihydrofolate reductase [Ignavibacteria bacterium]OIP60084.1 MAG: deaminase [Ignavibacteria bacterium CG2_30_36_16]PJB01139.1 MAG: dihydrofolate reductase [Ignavibacteria bacterium CG_4_9_14_3_um_filter_36_18]
MKITLYIAASLDGYIARSNGELDLLSIVEKKDEDYGYKKFYDSVDSIVMGRKTYDFCKDLQEWPYEGKDVFVFTNRQLSPNKKDIFFVKVGVREFVEELDNRGLNHLWLVGGGELVRLFVNYNLIDEYIISLLPIFLGEGTPLFPAPFKEQKIKLMSLKAYDTGLVQLIYQKIKN